MAIHYRRIADYLRSALAGRGPEQLARLQPRHDAPPRRVPGGSALTEESIEARWALPGLPESSRAQLADERTMGERDAYARNIENFIGTVRVPVGLAGPLRVNGAHALGDYYVPLATTEAALVASYSRGALLITEAGGCACAVLNEGVTRAPGSPSRPWASRSRSSPGPRCPSPRSRRRPARRRGTASWSTCSSRSKATTSTCSSSS
jgi:hydroxymethylglutaryl-CoA reductase (NADPH)